MSYRRAAPFVLLASLVGAAAAVPACGGNGSSAEGEPQPDSGTTVDGGGDALGDTGAGDAGGDQGADTNPPQDDLASLVYAPSFDPDYNRLTPQPWVDPATPEQTDDVVVKSDRLEFAKAKHPEVLTWTDGKVIAAAPGKATGSGKNPFGFARRMTGSVLDDGTTLTVMTESVSLEDVLQGDFQLVFDPSKAIPVDLSKVDLDWAAVNLYQNTDTVTLPGSSLADDDAVLYDDTGLPITDASAFWGKLWSSVKKGVASAGKSIGTAAKSVVSAAKNAWVAITPASFTGSVDLSKSLTYQQTLDLFTFTMEKSFNESGKTPIKLSLTGTGSLDASLLFNPGLQIGANIPVPGHGSSFSAWANIDSRAQTKLALDFNLEAKLESAGSESGSALETRLNNDAAFAADALGQFKDRLLGANDAKPVGGWKKTLLITRPATVTFAAGPVPVVLTSTFQLDLECGFEAKASLSTHVEFEQNATFKFGVKYENGKAVVTQAPKFDYKKRWDLQVTGGGSVTVACGLIPRVNAFVYDTVGLFAGVRASLVAKGELQSKCPPSATSHTPTGEVSIDLSANVGVQIGARVQAPGSSYAGTAGQKAGFDIGPFEPWTKEYPIWSHSFDLPQGLGYCLPACSNLAKDLAETDADCGGGQCPRCAVGKGCKKNSDCLASQCVGGTCQTTTCGDGVLDGVETDVDCGGSCATKCAIGKGCVLAGDCASGMCNRANGPGIGVCVSDACSDGIKDGDECGVDCGGAKCAKCAQGTLCSLASDCQTETSDGVYCVKDNCHNRLADLGESDVDCGYMLCSRRCGRGQACMSAYDCVETADYCDPTSHTCSASCHDGVKDADETDVDCGGGCHAKCALGKACVNPWDCGTGLTCFASGGTMTCQPGV